MKNLRGQIDETKNQRFFLAPLSQEPKKAQIGETMTWVVATVVIVVILGFSIFAVSVFSKDPSFNDGVFKWNRKADFLATKSLVNYLTVGGEYDKLKAGGELGDSSKKIVEYYRDDYVGSSQIGVGDKIYVSPNEVHETKCEVDVRIDLDNGKEVYLCLGSKD